MKFIAIVLLNLIFLKTGFARIQAVEASIWDLVTKKVQFEGHFKVTLSASELEKKYISADHFKIYVSGKPAIIRHPIFSPGNPPAFVVVEGDLSFDRNLINGKPLSFGPDIQFQFVDNLGQVLPVDFSESQAQPLVQIYDPTAPSLGVVPSYSSVLGSKKQALANFTFRYKSKGGLSALDPTIGGYELSGAISNQAFDSGAGAKFLWSKGAYQSTSYNRYEVGYRTNQPFTDRATTITVARGFDLPKPFNINSNWIRQVQPGDLTVQLDAAYRDRIDPIVSPDHLERWLVAPSLLLQTPNYFFSSNGENLMRKSRISLSFQVWRLLNGQSLTRVQDQRTVGRGDLTYTQPIRGAFGDLGNGSVIFALGYGADPSNSYAVGRNLSMCVSYWGKTINVGKY